ncbi:type IV secretion system protein [Aureimonas altamirensis]|uniref:type IV secretion system protein n=1 Tax=Aureimonas altamirensis TaxID=370622 RepID=UPI00255351F1|nr:type IV secretion system protein [Aureimonas altamirensis]
MPGSTTSAEAIQNGSAFDAVINQAIAVADEISEKGTWRNWYPIIISIVFSAAALIVTMVLLAIFLFAKVALALILVLGPIFIALVLFRVTQPFFSSWLAAVVNFVLLQILTVALITLLITLITDYLEQSQGQDIGMQIVMAWRVVGLFALSLYLGLNLPDIAARISGGGLALGGGLATSAISAIARFPGAGAAARAARSAGMSNTMTKG